MDVTEEDAEYWQQGDRINMKMAKVSLIKKGEVCETFIKFVYKMRFEEYQSMFFTENIVSYSEHKEYITSEVEDDYTIWVKATDNFDNDKIYGVGCYKKKEVYVR